MKEKDIQRELEVQRLRVDKRKPNDGSPPVALQETAPRYSPPVTTPAPEAVLNTKYADRPQPIDYGLTREELRLHGEWETPLGEKLKYKEAEGDKWEWFKILWFPVVVWFALCVWLQSQAELTWGTALTALIAIPLVVIYAVGPVMGMLAGRADAYKSKHPSPGILQYKEALRQHREYHAALQEAEQAALRRKRSYWAYLDGYEFERATAEVLKQHQFNPRVTRGSADGGVDIEVTRDGLKGVVQCKAHVACVGPHVVRDLYGVIHHSGADFGIIVSRGGFTRGAIDFASDKPILFVDVSDLIAMQEGGDVLAGAFSHSKD